MLRTAALAAAVVLVPAVPALAQDYRADPPPGYMAAPPPEWSHQDFWHHMDESQRHAWFDEWRHQRWRCDHGDRHACGWLHEHERG